MAPTDSNSTPTPHTAHSMPALRTTTIACCKRSEPWKDCSASEMVRKAIRRKHGPAVVESIHWIDGTVPYLSWDAPGFAMTATRLSTGALEIEEHEAWPE
jgi:hypothetical protein